jgi:hypothetical protein
VQQKTFFFAWPGQLIIFRGLSLGVEGNNKDDCYSLSSWPTRVLFAAIKNKIVDRKNVNIHEKISKCLFVDTMKSYSKAPEH